MSIVTLSVSGLSYHYEQSPEPLFTALDFSLNAGWTGIIGGNGAGKTTLLRLICGGLDLQGGGITGVRDRIYCPQETESPGDLLDEFFQSLYEGNNTAGRLFSVFALGHDWPYRWETLSHGERKRAQLAAALMREPDLLALDEPTNHLDADARNLLQEGLQGFDGVGLVVSHDRDFLGALCSGFLFVGDGIARYRPGTLEEVFEQESREKTAALRRYENLKQRYEQLKGETQARRETSAQKKKGLSGRTLSAKDHDGRARQNGLRLTGKDTIGDALAKKMQSRAERTRTELEAAAKDKPRFRKSGITIDGAVSSRDYLVRLPAGTLPLGAGRSLRYPDLVIAPGDRVALLGVNGSGKSTLIRKLFANGGIRTGETLHIPQEYGELERLALAGRFGLLNCGDLGELLSHFYRLNGKADQVHSPELLSPGEFRKLALAEGLFRSCTLIILDEPTNHLDLPSRMAIEEALGDYPGALLVVSHDRAFREKLCTVCWEIAGEVLTLHPSRHEATCRFSGGASRGRP